VLKINKRRVSGNNANLSLKLKIKIKKKMVNLSLFARTVLKYTVFTAVPFGFFYYTEGRFIDPTEPTKSIESTESIESIDSNVNFKKKILKNEKSSIFYKLKAKRVSILVGLTSLTITKIYSNETDVLLEDVLKYVSLLRVGTRSQNIIKKIRSLTTNDLELDKIVQTTNGKKRVIILTTGVTLIIIFLTKDTPGFALVLKNLKELFNDDEDRDDLRNSIIKLYRECKTRLF
jgi:hypothetical protein